VTLTPEVVRALVAGEHADPFSILGPHRDADGTLRIRVFAPGARAVDIVGLGGDGAHPLRTLDPGGLWDARATRLPPATVSGSPGWTGETSR
jgi:1,4-alpha-glucan branching enzyme